MTAEEIRALEAEVAVVGFGWQWLRRTTEKITEDNPRYHVGLYAPERDGWMRWNYGPEWFCDVTEEYVANPDAFERFCDWDRTSSKFVKGERKDREVFFGLPCYVTDPAATAEVKREICERGWNYSVHGYGGQEIAQATVFGPPIMPPGENTSTHLVPAFTYSDGESTEGHNGDPIRAEATALVRAFLAACRATGDGRREGENGE